MRKVTVMGLYVNKNDSFGLEDGGTSYGNRLGYPAVRARALLEKEGFSFFSEEELSPEEADIVLCIDLSSALLERIRRMPKGVRKILQACESPIYNLQAHQAKILMEPCWDVVLTWNRSFDASYVLHYDLPVAGKSASSSGLPAARPVSVEPGLCHGVVVSSFKNGDHRGVAPERDDLYRLLAKRGWIDLYGKGWPVSEREHRFGPAEDKLAVIVGHPFALVIENCWAPGYVTEKLPDSILAGAPVIYRGDFPTAERRFPGTFVRLEDLSEQGFFFARRKLFDSYAAYYENVLAARENSDTWCDSYLEAVRQAFLRVV